MNFTRILQIICLGSIVCAQAPALPLPASDNHAAVNETQEQRDARMKWWRDAKFGMFVHYGLYSGLAGVWKGKQGGSEWIQKNVEVDTDEYAAEALPLFQPKPGFADEWAQLAKDAGCQYAVMTTKHHDGFALFDTATTDYDAKDKKGRDLVREYVDAIRKQGLKVGFYHSVIDWHQQDYDNTICPDLCYPKNQIALLKNKGIPRNHAAYQKYLHTQVRELLSNYGPIDIIWWDYSQGDAEGEKGWKAPSLIETCRKLHPGIIMNNRLYSYSGLDKTKALGGLDVRCGDFMTPEQHIPAEGYPGTDWEACMTVSDKWGFNRFDTNVKSTETIIRKLVECTAKGGNLLINVNPMADGTIPPKVAAALRGVGPWLKTNGEAIYAAKPVQGLTLPEGCYATTSPDGIYIFLPPLDIAKKQAAMLNGKYWLVLDSRQLGAANADLLGMPGIKPGIGAVNEHIPATGDVAHSTIITIPLEAWDKLTVPVVKLTSEI